MPGLPEYVRVFTAVELSPDLRRSIFGAARGLYDGLGKVTPVQEENLHITVKFVGEVRRGDLPLLSETVADCARLLHAGSVDLSGAGAFPDLRRPRVLWAGVSDPDGILTPVFERLNEEMSAFGAKKEHRRFEPHVTTARVRGRFDGAAFTERIRAAGELWYGTQAVEALTLFMSEIERGDAPRYTALGHYGG